MPGPERAGRFDLADIVRAHRAELEATHPLSHAQKRALNDIAKCRTAVLGGHVDRCMDCGYERPAYNSCRNRHCPKCQALAQEKWIADRRAEMLDVEHFHVVFTLPAELRPLALFAPRVVYNALFHASERTLLEFGESRLKATIGATLVLHTWSRDLRLHPHVHAIVTGGGLALDASRWNTARRNFLFLVKAMGRVLRGKMKHALRQAYRQGRFARFEAFDDPQGFDQLLRSISTKRWNVYAKPTFDTGGHVLHYLGRYTHRVGIANSRLREVTPDRITFDTKDGGVESLSPVAFLARFVQHVLPYRFHKVRHVGLYASRPLRTVARRVLGMTEVFVARPLSWRDRLQALTGRDLSRCPRCGGPLVSFAVPAQCARAPPEQAA